MDITTIGLGVDTSKLKAGTKELDNFGRSADKAAGKADGLTGSTQKLGKESSLAAVGLGKMGVAAAAVVSVGSIVRMIDEYTKFNAQLKLATKTQVEYNAALSDVTRIAKTAQADIGTIAALYSRLSNSLSDLGVTQKQIADVTETVGLSLRIAGASAGESSSAMLQLSQAFGSGVLRGEEFNAMMESAPNLMRVLAASVGVPVGKLRELASDGKITSDILLKAFGDPKLLETYREQAKQIGTISGGWQVFTNQLVVAIGKINEATGASKILIGVLTTAATLLSIFEGGEKGSILRNFLDKGQSAEAIRLAGLEIAELKKLVTWGNAAAKAALDAKEAAAKANFGGDLLNKSFSPNFSAGIVAQDVNKIHAQQEAAAVKTKEASDKAIELAKKTEAEKLAIWQKAFDAKKEQDIKWFEDELELEEYYAKQKTKLEEERIDKLQKIADENYKKAQKEFEEAEDKKRKEIEKTADFINTQITEALMRGFEKGIGFAKNFRDTLKNMFKTLILQPIIKFLVDASGISKVLAAIGGIFSGGAAAAGEAASASGGGISGVFGAIKSIFSGGNAAIINAIERFGATIANGMGGIGDTIGGFIGANAGMIANLSTFAGAALSFLKGDFKGAAFQGIGAGIGLAIAGPIGGAIGSFLGGALGGLFGKKKIKRFGSTVSGTYDGEQYMDTKRSKFYDRDLGAGNALSALNKQFSDSFAFFLKGFDLKSVFSLSSSQYQRGKSKKSGGSFSGEINGQSFGGSVMGRKLSPEAVFNMLTEKMLGEGLAMAIMASDATAGIKKFFATLTKKEDVADAINTLVGLNRQLGDLPKVFDAIRNAMDTTKYQSSIADLKAQFAAIGTYTSLFYTAKEQFATFTKQLTSQLDTLDTALPKSRDEYRKLVDGITVTDEASRGLFNGLVSLAPAMDAYFKQLEEQKNLLNSFRTEDFFASLVAFKRYTGVAGNFGTEFANQYTDNLPSFASGANSLPSDMVAQVHAGERIVPAADNQAIIQALNNNGLKQMISNLIVEIRSGNVSIIQAAQKTAKVMQRIDDEGVMINETNNAGKRTVLDTRVVV